jgi:hypothetical protein
MADAVDKTPVKLIQLYKKMADMTLVECKSACKRPYSCCSPEYCEFTLNFAEKRGVTLQETGHPRLPLMGPEGCVAPPHLRPMCAVHTCEIQSLGYKKSDPTGAWDRAYYDLRSQIEEMEMDLIK